MILNVGFKLVVQVGFKLVVQVGIDVLLQFLFQLINFGLNVGIFSIFKVLVASVGHGEGKTREEVGKKGG